MIVERLDGSKQLLEQLSAKEAANKVEEMLDDDTVTKITITPNRHERRRQAALDRKEQKRGK